MSLNGRIKPTEAVPKTPYITNQLKGESAKTRPPETLNCTKSKMCRSINLKLHQPV